MAAEPPEPDPEESLLDRMRREEAGLSPEERAARQAEDERMLADAYPHHYFPDECSYCRPGETHPVIDAMLAFQREAASLPAAELDHISMTIRFVMDESIMSELVARHDWRKRYDPQITEVQE